MGADKIRFGSQHTYLMDRKNRYPKNIHECHTLLKGWRNPAMDRPHFELGYHSTRWVMKMVAAELHWWMPGRKSTTRGHHAVDVREITTPLIDVSLRSTMMAHYYTWKGIFPTIIMKRLVERVRMHAITMCMSSCLYNLPTPQGRQARNCLLGGQFQNHGFW